MQDDRLRSFGAWRWCWQIVNMDEPAAAVLPAEYLASAEARHNLRLCHREALCGLRRSQEEPVRIVLEWHSHLHSESAPAGQVASQAASAEPSRQAQRWPGLEERRRPPALLYDTQKRGRDRLAAASVAVSSGLGRRLYAAALGRFPKESIAAS